MEDSSNPKYENTLKFIKESFYNEYLEALKESIRIPSLNTQYDPDW